VVLKSMLELAKLCNRTDESVTLTKLEAAQEQLEGAIHCLFTGNWACAVTLAGAAEGILPETGKCDDLFSVGRRLAVDDHGMNEKDYVAMYNQLLYWLKHNEKNKSDHKVNYSIGQQDAVQLVLRAYSRFCAHQSPLQANEAHSEITGLFEQWFRQNYSDWLKPGATDLETTT
jgi:hypothetical protein